MSLDPNARPPIGLLPPRLIALRSRTAWVLLALAALVVASFWSLDLQWRDLWSRDSLAAMARFAGEFFPPDTSPPFVRKVAQDSGTPYNKAAYEKEAAREAEAARKKAEQKKQ